MENVVFTKNEKRLFEEYNLSDFVYRNKEKGFYFESEDIKKIVDNMEKYRCPDKDCAFIGDNWDRLKNHVIEVHDKKLW